MDQDHLQQVRCAVAVVLVMLFTLLSGCVAQQADLKQTERTLQQKLKQQDDQFSQTRARQSQEISTLREQDLPQLRGELEKARHQAEDLQSKQEDLKHRSAQLEQQTKKLEQLAAKLEADTNTRYVWLQKSLETQDAKVNARLDELSKMVSKATDDLKRDVLTAVKQSNEVLDRKVAERLDGQRRDLEASQQSLDQKVSQNLTQFNQSLTGFKTAFTSLNDRVIQDEQETRAISGKVDAENKAAVSHINESNRSMSGHLDGVNKSVASVVKTLESVSQKFTARFDEQDRRIDSLGRSLEQVGQKNGGRTQSLKQAQRSTLSPAPEAPAPERHVHEAEPAPSSSLTQSQPVSSDEAESSAAPVASIPAPVDAPVVAAPAPAGDIAADRGQYERVLALFRDGDLEGARRGFSAFIANYPNSDLAPNARYWLGEAYYGAKDFKRAIDAYDKVESDYPRSEKVPAAILKKGYAYLALKDKKRASSAFKQVVTLYPRSPEAGKASDKLVQLKEGR
ncbi:putative Tol-Pal system protein YbgF (Modular protein) [Nitrospira lenta]|uniref:Putative Tol-Pal system protein YbgF (Modular protein) n=1 Tax=Nitrospira lenta TaxID=1436998 RepID=A0A330L8W4_9BACT|nr:putative Tol-Pal system protein YbgF (Modular protein) [Nitrospira lenta]